MTLITELTLIIEFLLFPDKNFLEEKGKVSSKPFTWVTLIFLVQQHNHFKRIRKGEVIFFLSNFSWKIKIPQSWKSLIFFIYSSLWVFPLFSVIPVLHLVENVFFSWKASRVNPKIFMAFLIISAYQLHLLDII